MVIATSGWNHATQAPAHTLRYPTARDFIAVNRNALARGQVGEMLRLAIGQVMTVIDEMGGTWTVKRES